MAAFDNLKSLDPTKKALSLFDEFKAFAFKGNVIDLAVAVIIGSAFGKVVDSLVKQILLPLIAAITPGKEGYVGWKETINGSEIHYGQFIGEVVNFLLVALAVFIFIVKFLGWMMRSASEGSGRANSAVVQARGTLDRDSRPAQNTPSDGAPGLRGIHGTSASLAGRSTRSTTAT